MECKLDQIPPGYKEIYCSNNQSGDRAFICESGYSFSPPSDSLIINTNPTATPCNFQSIRPQCIKQDYQLPHIIRPDNSENFECTLNPSSLKSSTNIPDKLTKLKECLKHNRSREYSIKDVCEADTQNDCSYERYKGDYLVKTENTNTPTTYEIISNQEKQLVYPTLGSNPININPGVNPGISNTTITPIAPLSGGNPNKSISLHHYDYKNTSSSPTIPIPSIKQGANIFPETGTNAYIGYKISHNDNHYMGTTGEGLIHKISSGETSYHPGSAPSPALNDINVECNQNSFFHSIGNPYISTTGNLDPALTELSGCEINMCKQQPNDDYFTSIYEVTQPTECSDSFYTCGGDEELFSTYMGPTCPQPSITVTSPKLIHESIGYNYCGMIDTERECDKNDKCYWYQSAGEDLSECRNKCESRKTKGQCEQFYTGNQNVISDTIYNFDGKDHNCQWHPSYFNSDVSIGSTDGTCRDTNSYSFPSLNSTNVTQVNPTNCLIHIDGKDAPIQGTIHGNYCFPDVKTIKDAYCNYNYINYHEEECIKHSVDNCPIETCSPKRTPYKCVSDGELFVDLRTRQKRYKTDEECMRLNNNSSQVCRNEPGCLPVPSKDICEAKSINELMKNKSNYHNLCKPLKAQIPNGYDVNLVEEEGTDLSSYSERHNKDPPYKTSKYLCDICTIRDNDIQNRNYSGDLYYDINNPQEDDQTYCEKPIDKYDTINPRKPCKFVNNKCISRCKEPFLTNPIDLSKTGMEEAKRRCSRTLQYSDTERSNILFPNVDANSGNDITDDYYKDMYCSWDGFECNNSIPCKDAQRTRCEDLGYDWYEGTARDANNQKLNPDILSTIYPIKHKKDGKPIIGDSQGLCIFPNTDRDFVGTAAEYTIRNTHVGEHGIVLYWREYGTDWEYDYSLFRRKFYKLHEDSTANDELEDTDPNDFIRSRLNDSNKNTDVYLGEHVIFIPYRIQGSESPDDIKNMINTSLRSYEYFTMNGEYMVWAKTIYDWATGKVTNNDNNSPTNYTKLWYHTDHDTSHAGTEGHPYHISDCFSGDTILKHQNKNDYIAYFGGYSYYKYGKVIPDQGDGPKKQKNIKQNDGTILSTDEEVIMANVVYDLRGIIPIIPVIDGKCKLEVTHFNINPNTGYIDFSMYHMDNPDHRFEFVKFIGPESNDDTNPTDDTDPTDIYVYRRRVKNFFVIDTSNTQSPRSYDNDFILNAAKYIKRLPVDTSQGYGSLYEPFIKANDRIYSPSVTRSTDTNFIPKYKDNDNYTKKIISPIESTLSNQHFDKFCAIYRNSDGNYSTGHMTASMLINIMEKLKNGHLGKNIHRNFKKLYALYDKYINNVYTDRTGLQQFIDHPPLRYHGDTAGVTESIITSVQTSPILRTTFVDKTDINTINTIKVGSGSIEGWKLLLFLSNPDDFIIGATKYATNGNGTDDRLGNTTGNRGVEKGQWHGCSFNYNNNQDRKYDAFKVKFEKLSWSTHPFHTLLKQYSKNKPTAASLNELMPKDIRKATLWSMTRNVHPAFGDMIYDPDYDYNNPDSRNPYSGNDLPFVTEMYEDDNKINTRDAYDEYKKHLLDPFHGSVLMNLTSETDNNSLINWENLLRYLGKNYNKIVQYDTLYAPYPSGHGWPTHGSPNPSFYNLIKDIPNPDPTGYYADTFINYIDLASNNVMCKRGTDILSENHRANPNQTPTPKTLTNICIDSGGDNTKANLIINNHFFTNESGTWKDYFRPGHWLNPSWENSEQPTPTTNWPIRGPGNQAWITSVNPTGDQAGILLGEDNPELQKLKLLAEAYGMDAQPPSHSPGDYNPRSSYNPTPALYNSDLYFTEYANALKMGLSDELGFNNVHAQQLTGPPARGQRAATPSWDSIKTNLEAGLNSGFEVARNERLYTSKPLYSQIYNYPVTTRIDGAKLDGAGRTAGIDAWPNVPGVYCGKLLSLSPNQGYDGNTEPYVEPLTKQNCSLPFYGNDYITRYLNNGSLDHPGDNAFNQRFNLNSSANYYDGILATDITSSAALTTLTPLPYDRSSISAPQGDAFNSVRDANNNYTLFTSQYNYLAYTGGQQPPDYHGNPIATPSSDIRRQEAGIYNSKQSIRDICPDVCQYYPRMPTIDRIPLSEYTKPNDVSYDIPLNGQIDKNPLWIIPANPPQNHPIFNKGYSEINFFTYYAAKLPGQNSTTDPINGLFTQDGRETIHTFAVPTQILVPYTDINDDQNKESIKNSHIFNKSSPINTAPSPTYCRGDPNDPNVDPSHPLCVYPSPYSSRVLNISELVKHIDNFSCRTAIHESLGSECITRPTDTMPSCIAGNSMVQLHCGSDAQQRAGEVVTKYNLVKNRIEPWLHLGQEQQPANYGSSIKPDAKNNSPYSNSFTNCKPTTGNSPTSSVTFTKINEAPLIEFFKPRFGSQGVNHIFSHRGDNSGYSFGCIRDDIMNVDESYFDLSCNTNTSYPIERNKFVLINRIIEESIQANPTSPKLNISDRTKLVLMDEEELLYKANELGLNMEELNQYTKPKLTSRVKDIYDPETRKFEIWDDLESNYLNIQPNPLNSRLPKLGVKEWEFIGCGLDFNNIDNTRTYQTCKDKYPGLCQRNIGLCNSPNQSIKEAIHRDCPETCKSQFNSLSQFENQQIGDLSICSERGRCKWSRDQDDANLLPYCDQESARDYGDNDKCINFKNKKVGSCEINDNTLNCMREKCLSMTGCEFTAGNPEKTCLISNKIRNNMSAENCNHHGGTWSGRTGELGSCIIPAYSDTSLTQEQCNAIQGTYIPESDSTCLFNSHNWTPLEDPCKFPHNVNFNALTDQQKTHYQNKLSQSINIDHIEPECIGTQAEILQCQQGRKHPGGFKITLVAPIPNLIEGDYIHITTQQLSDNCSPYLVGYSKVLQVLDGGNSFIIRGPNQAYTLERSLFDSTQYEIGSCLVDEQYRVYTTSTPDSIQVCKDKAVTTGSSCTYIDSEDPMMESNICKSCSLIESRDECITDNRASSCGWGELRDVCEALGDIGACNDMYSEGCYWDHDKETCLLNQYRKTEGCMKCSDLKYAHTCNSLSNCFWKNNQCQSCGETFPGSGPTTMPTAQACNRESEGKCQWRNEQGAGEFRCRPVDPYPLIYEWIWYNKWLLVSIVFVLYLFIKLPLGTTSLGLRGSVIATIVLFIVRIMIIFVVIPGLFIVPGITRADGKDGRKYYVDPPLNPNKPGYLDFLHDENMEGALWPATIYDNRWDDKIMDDDTLRSIVDFEIYPESLNWSEYLFWTPIRKWNTLMNNNTGKTTIFFFFMIMGFVFILYSGSFYKLNKVTTHSKRTYILLFVIISVLIWLEYLEKTYQERKYSDDLANNQSKYYGRQTTAYPSDSILHIFSSIPTQDNALNPIHVCPYGCRLYTDTTPLPSNSPNIFPNPTLYPECGDTRSLFSFKGDLDPDAKKIIKTPYDPSDPLSLQKWKIYQGDTGVNHICPVKQEYYKWPYDNMCKDKHHQCVADDTYEVAIPTDITQPVNPSPGTKHVNKRGDEFKNKVDEMCRQQYNTYDTCEPYSVSNLSFNEKSDTTNITSKINVNCTFKDKDDNWLSCPFPENTVYLDYAEGEQRLPIKGWQTLWDKIAGVTPRRLGKAEKINWQNQERYEIVDQNYSIDHN